MTDDSRFMEQALREAEKAYEAGEVPIGCVLVKEGRILAKGRNSMEGLKDPTAHAEILAIGAAATALGNWRLEGCTLYCTLEPCPMCAGAILNARIGRVVFGATDRRLGALGSTYDILAKNPIGRVIAVEGGLFAEESLYLIQDFFRHRRKEKKA